MDKLIRELNPRQREFVRHYVLLHGNGTQAYIAAGYAPRDRDVAGNLAARLRGDERVRAAIAAEYRRIEKAHEITVEGICRELDEARSLAMDTEAPNAAIAASMAKAKLAGLVTDKSEVMHTRHPPHDLPHVQGALQAARDRVQSRRIKRIECADSRDSKDMLEASVLVHRHH